MAGAGKAAQVTTLKLQHVANREESFIGNSLVILRYVREKCMKECVLGRPEFIVVVGFLGASYHS